MQTVDAGAGAVVMDAGKSEELAPMVAGRMVPGCFHRLDVTALLVRLSPEVKRIVVNPGASLSLQMHHHRAEHWIVVQGTARVTHGDEVFLVSENQSTYIPLGERHRLENPGKVPLEMIEVQSGSYLGEDDIVRFEDVYGR